MKSEFLKNYVKVHGFSNISKSEFEKIVFYELVFVKNICGFKDNSTSLSLTSKDIYTIAEQLKIKPSKVSSLLKDIFYSGIESNSANKQVVNVSACEIICKYISKDRFEKERLELLISNPVEYEIIERYLLERNARYDTSFNRKIMKIDFLVLDSVFNEQEKKEILEKMKIEAETKQGKKLESINLKANFLNNAKEIAKFAIETVFSSAIQSVTKKN